MQNFRSITQFIDGNWFLYNSESMRDKSNLLKYKNQDVQCLVWIPLFIEQLLNVGSYIQLDASFYALRPYVFSLPLLIYNNASILIGIVVGLSESVILYDVLYKSI